MYTYKRNVQNEKNLLHQNHLSNPILRRNEKFNAHEKTDIEID